MSIFSTKFPGRAAALAFLLPLALLVAAGCGGKQGKAREGRRGEGLEVSELRYQGVAGGVKYPELAEDLGYLHPLKLKWVGNTASGPQDIQAVASGDIDFGSAFNGSIARMVYAKAPLKLVIAHSGLDEKSWTGYYVLEGSPIRRGRDLIGKKIAINTLGAHHEFMIREYLKREGLTRDEIKQVSLVVVPGLNGEQALRQKQVDVACLGSVSKEEALTRGGIRPLFTDYGLFGRKFSTGGFAMNERFIRENPNATRKFVEATARAVYWAQTHPRDEVIARYEKIIRQRGRNENTKPLKYLKSTGIAGKGGVLAESEVQIWIDYMVRDGEVKPGSFKACDVYTNEFNPYREQAGKTTAMNEAGR